MTGLFVVVWCYPFRDEHTLKGSIMAISRMKKNMLVVYFHQ